MTAPLRIAYVLTQEGGGPVDVTTALVRWATTHPDLEVRLFAPRPCRGAELIEDHLEAVDVPRKSDIRGARELRRRLRDWAPDVVHAQDRRAGLACLGLGGRKHFPIVVHTYHGVPEDVPQDWLVGRGGPRPSRYTLATLAADALVARGVDATVVVASMMGDFLRRRMRVPTERLVHIDNGLWLPPAAPPASVRRLIFVGALIPRKAVSDLVDAMALLWGSGLELTVVGDGEEASTLVERTNAAGVRESVTFAGFRADVHDLLAEADMLVLPSLMEQQPLVIIEALGAGKLVCATAVAGVPDMLADLSEGTRLVPPGRPDLLAAGIRALAQTADPTSAGAVNARRARERFSIEVCGERHLELYRQLLARHR